MTKWYIMPGMATRAERIVKLAGEKGLFDPKPTIETPREKVLKIELIEQQKIEKNRAKFEKAGLIQLLEELKKNLPFSKIVFLREGMVIRFMFAGNRVSDWETDYKAVDFAVVDRENAHFFDEESSYNVAPINQNRQNIIARYRGIFFSKPVVGLYVNKSVVGVDGDIEELISGALANPIKVTEVEHNGDWDGWRP